MNKDGPSEGQDKRKNVPSFGAKLFRQSMANLTKYGRCRP